MDFMVIDTDVISYQFKGDTRGDLYARHLQDRLGVLSFMTIAELDLWADLHNWGQKKRLELSAFLEPFIIIESDRELCQKWAVVRAQAQQKGRHIDTADAWVAATALLYQVPLATHNRVH